MERLKRRLPLLLITLLLTSWVAYAYLDFIGIDITFFRILFWGLLTVALAECITTNRWTGIITGGACFLHIIASLLPIPGLHAVADLVNACALDTYEKVFWTDRHFFVSEIGTVFFVFFVIAFSLHLVYTKVKSVGLAALLSLVYLFFMEFFNVADSWLVIVCLVHMLFALLVLYGYQWHNRAGTTTAKRKSSLRYGIPLLCIILIVTTIFTMGISPMPNSQFHNWLNDTLQNMWQQPADSSVNPRFSHEIFEKNGKIGGNISFSDKHLFSVVSYDEETSLYLRGIAYDHFREDAWQTAIDTGRDKSLEEYFAENMYFCGEGWTSFVQEAVAEETGLFQPGEVAIFYDNEIFDVLLHHTYTTNLIAYHYNEEEKAYYDASTYTYHKGEVNAYQVSYLNLIRKSTAMETLLQNGFITSFSEEKRLDANHKKQLEAYYLQLPEDMSASVAAMAERLTLYDTNDYEKAASIEKYLKNNYTYTLKPGDVPKDKNLVEYFLFDSKKGYCTYYASAMVMLCRSIGIPARYVSGFRVDNMRKSILMGVKESASHAWVEVFIPQLGWVTFDPVSAADFAQNDPSYVPNIQPSSTPVPSTPKPTPSVSGGTTPTPTMTEGQTATPMETPKEPSSADIQTPKPSITEEGLPSTPTPPKEKSTIMWWIIGIGGSLLLISGFLCILFMKKKGPTVSEQERLQKAPEQFYLRFVRVKTFMGMPLQTGETVSQYIRRLQTPQMETIIAVLEECFYNQAKLTKEQYETLQAILQQEESAAIAQKGKIKWLRFCLKHKF